MCTIEVFLCLGVHRRRLFNSRFAEKGARVRLRMVRGFHKLDVSVVDPTPAKENLSQGSMCSCRIGCLSHSLRGHLKSLRDLLLLQQTPRRAGIGFARFWLLLHGPAIPGKGIVEVAGPV